MVLSSLLGHETSAGWRDVGHSRVRVDLAALVNDTDADLVG